MDPMQVVSPGQLVVVDPLEASGLRVLSVRSDWRQLRGAACQGADISPRRFADETFGLGMPPEVVRHDVETGNY